MCQSNLLDMEGHEPASRELPGMCRRPALSVASPGEQLEAWCLISISVSRQQKLASPNFEAESNQNWFSGAGEIACR